MFKHLRLNIRCRMLLPVLRSKPAESCKIEICEDVKKVVNVVVSCKGCRS